VLGELSVGSAVELAGRTKVANTARDHRGVHGQAVFGSMINLHRNALIEPRWNCRRAFPHANPIPQFHMHEFVRDDVDVLTVGSDKDAGARTNEMGAAIRVKAQRPERLRVVEDGDNRVGARGAKGLLNSGPGSSLKTDYGGLRDRGRGSLDAGSIGQCVKSCEIYQQASCCARSDDNECRSAEADKGGQYCNQTWRRQAGDNQARTP
jgi:hypothetical protein